LIKQRRNGYPASGTNGRDARDDQERPKLRLLVAD
jgi:hypothetical protein